jgi:hypothetical protein
MLRQRCLFGVSPSHSISSSPHRRHAYHSGVMEQTRVPISPSQTPTLRLPGYSSRVMSAPLDVQNPYPARTMSSITLSTGESSILTPRRLGPGEDSNQEERDGLGCRPVHRNPLLLISPRFSSHLLFSFHCVHYAPSRPSL